MFTELNEVQKSIYFECLSGSSRAYNISAALSVRNLDAAVLKQALALLVSEQEALRSRIAVRENQPELEVCDEAPVAFAALQAKDAAELDQKVKEAMFREFDLGTLPLYHTSLIRSADKTVLVVVMHHLISDGLSTDLFVRKLFSFYYSLRDAQPFSLDCNTGYRQFMEKENKKLSAGKYDRKRDFWIEKMKGAEPLSLIPERIVTEPENGIGSELRFPLRPELYRKITELARENDMSAFMVVLGAFSLLMGRYANTEDVVLSSSFSYRPGIAQDDAIGCFIYTLPLRFQFGEIRTFSDLIRKSSENVLQAYKNVGYPNNLIARDVLPADQMIQGSLFDITFISDMFEGFNEDIEGLYETDEVTFPGKMMVILQTIGENSCVKFQYKPQFFSDEMIRGLGNHFVRLLEAAAANPEEPLANLEWFTEGEKQALLCDWNKSDFFPFVPRSIADVFEEKVQADPDAPALIAGDRTYTNAEVNTAANRIAEQLLSVTHGENLLVGVQLERSFELIAVLLGVLKAGCGYVPIDLHYPEERKAFMMRDASISVVVTNRGLMSDAFAGATVFFADDPETFAGDAANPQIQRNPEDLAYVEYTSGSTGTPKGVMITNQNVVNTVLDLERRFPLGEQDVYLLKTTYTFDIFGTEFYGWIVGKGMLCLLEHDGEKKPEAIMQAVFDHHVTHINFVPSMFRLFLEAAEHDASALRKLQSLKWIFLGGEAVTQDIMQKYFSLGLHARTENMYGPTEATMWATTQPLRNESANTDPYIGAPLNAYRCYVVDRAGKLCPVGVPGELCISGAGLAKGYLNRPELTADRFTENPFFCAESDDAVFSKMYRTGDLARRTPDGNLEFLGRIDFQVKIGGVRIELGEIETALGKHPQIVQAAAVVRKDHSGMDCICAYYTGAAQLQASDLRAFLTEHVPAYMIPAHFIFCDEMPLNNSGKTDRKALLAMPLPTASRQKSEKPSGAVADIIAQAWQDVLGTDDFGVNDSFFEIGGHSFSLIRVHNILKEKLDPSLSINDLIQYPTIKKLAEHLSGSQDQDKHTAQSRSASVTEKSDIAIVGIAVDVPGATDVQAFWDVLKNGRETIHFYDDEELRSLGISEDLIRAKNYVKAKGRVEDLEEFDSFFFGISPKETELASPSLRLLYKGTWRVLEDAGYMPETFDGRIGMFLGGSDDFTWYRHALFRNQSYSDTYQAYTMSTNHFLATRLSYKFDFKGPAMTALTGCSTSLVTAHLACRSLQAHECEMAIAGGITVETPNEGGYLYESGMMFSPDGHCRPFDAKAAGTVFSNGMALLAMRRLEDAVRDGDHIYAVIRGSALNNDGSNKISYTAPSENGQLEVIRQAYQNAGVSPQTVRYVEAHGTGTLLGDPIEVSSLTRAFDSTKKQFCVLGSLKGNIGHTDTAAGAVGLSKVSLCLDRKFLPATVNYDTPNPKANFEETPFIVKNVGEEWKRTAEHPEIPLRAGINSFGVGGTNAHFVLEEAPMREDTPADSLYHILPFSAKTESALQNTMHKVLHYLAENPQISLADAAFTLRNGRRTFEFRRFAALTEDMRTPEAAEELLKRLESRPVSALNEEPKHVCFMFSGQGSQYQGMGKDLYFGSGDEFVCRVFREEADRILNCLPEAERAEYFDVLYGTEHQERINQTQYTQFALFLTEYAVAQVLLRLRVEPAQLLGHSIGEVTAAAVAGVWSLEDAVKIVVARGKLMQSQKPGSMLAVMTDAENILPFLPDSLWLCLRNTTARCVVGGSHEDIEAFSAVLKEKGIGNTVLRTSHAFHTGMMQEAAEKFRALLDTVTFHAPKYPIISNVTGKIADQQILTPQYWADHIMNCVLFEQDLGEMFAQPDGVAVEIGPGRTLTTFAAQHSSEKKGWTFVNTVRHIKETASDIAYLYETIGLLESAGAASADLKNLGLLGKRVSLPGYVFDPTPYPIRISVAAQDTDVQETASEAKAAKKQQYAVITDIETAEHYVTYAYTEVFGFTDLDMDADFFAVGGDSLKAVSMAAALKNVLGVQIEVNDIFSNATPRKLAAFLLEHHKTDAGSTQLEPAPEQDYYEISAAQRRMYTMYLMNREALAYNLPSATVITGHLEPDRVCEAVRKLMQRHELLRSVFEMRGSEIVQVIREVPEELPVTFTEKNLDTEEAFQQAAAAFVKPFCLETGPLFRMELADIGNGQQMLFFDIHHIIADGTGVEILTRDFNTLYFEDMEPLRLQYKDYAYWQNAEQHSERMQQQEQYWLSRLQGELPVLELPTDHPRKEISSVSGGRVKFDVPKEAEQAVSQLGKQFGATNFMILLTVWYVLLARYSGQDDIIVGTPVSGRTLDDTREMIGMFVNMLAIRNYPGGSKYFSDFLQEVKENVLQALQNQDYQFNTLTERLHIQRKLNRNALFDVSFDYHNMTLYDLEVNGLKFGSREIDSNAVSTDLILTFNEDSDKNLTGCVDYATDLFERDTVERMVAHFMQILQYAAVNPECRLEEIPLISAQDLDIILRQFSNTAQPESLCIQELFAETAARIPDETALIAPDGTQYTYAALDRESNRIAHALRAEGVAAESCVGIMAERSAELVIAVLAVLKAGGTYIPLDVTYPAERIQYMVSQCEMAGILASERYVQQASELCRTWSFPELAERPQTDALPLISKPDHTAYMIFTSGSTGQPKGVMVKHSNVINLIRDHQARKLFAEPSDRIACIASPSFDIFVFETLIPLCSGGSVYMASTEEQLDSVLLSRKMLQYQINYLQAPVSRLRAMTDNTDFRAVLPQLRVVVGGGEMYPLSLMYDLRAASPARLFNMYGPTETTVTATVKELTDSDYVNIGSAVANAQLLVTDEAGRLLPVGVYGELCIAGAGVSKGYLNRPDETEKRFITVQIDEAHTVPVYRTGDRARLLANGEAELAGRMDHQVKIRGYRVELGEIEKAAVALEGVAYAAAKTFSAENGNTQLALFFSLSDPSADANAMQNALLDTLKKKLPAYMIPSALVPLKDMPVLQNGKVDRKALVLPSGEAKADTGSRKQAGNAGTKLEVEILKIWKQVLNTDSISVKDNFFDIGGNSYSLMLVNNRLNDLLGQNVSLMTLFEYPTVESLAQAVAADDADWQETVTEETTADDTDIAVIGMFGRFPGADSPEQFWENIRSGKESVAGFTEDELRQAGIRPEEYNDPDYVNAKGSLSDVEYFDADFFRYMHREANVMDPQMRILHMCVWNALEDAGYDPYRYDGRIGLFAGSSSNMAWMTKFLSQRENALSAFEVMTINDKDFLTTKISYKLNLKGPSMNVQTACSTSLVAIHQAVSCLQSGETDIAVAGGVSVTYPRKEGYLWHEGMIYSKDGHCRPFSDDSSGTVPGNGCAVVVLKKLSAALRDRDHIYAVVKGSAINNDGSDKIGYTAPSITGEIDVIRKALRKSGVRPEEIQFAETHGTGTALGDPIEIAALQRAWHTDAKQTCALGAVKANIGHLDAAAGAAGFIKAVQVLQHKTIPPMVNFHAPNAKIDLANSPFYITTESKPITAQTAHASVSAFGIGGTNAHVILEEAPKDERRSAQDRVNLLVFSAKTESALAGTAASVCEYLSAHPEISLSDAAYTLQTGRGEFEYRQTYVYTDGKQTETVTGCCADGQKISCWAIPETGFDFRTDLCGKTDGLGQIYTRYADEILRELRYQEAHAVREALKTGAAEEPVIRNLSILTAGYAAMKTVAALTDAPARTEAAGIALLCTEVFAGTVTPADAVKQILGGQTDSSQAPSQKTAADTAENVLAFDRTDAETLCLMLAKVWVSGGSVNWKLLHGDAERYRVSLPGYQFDRVAFDSDVSWAEQTGFEQSAAAEAQTETINCKDAFAAIWKDVLGTAPQSDSDDFFALGGESFHAVTMASLIHKRLHADVPVSELMDASQYGRILGLILARAGGQSDSAADGEIPLLPEQSTYETSYAQKRMYTVQQMLGDSTNYNLAAVYRITGSLDTKKLGSVLDELVARHESFRTSFEIEGDAIVQRIHKQVPSVLSVETCEPEQLQAALDRAVRPFDLSKAPLMRVHVVSLGDQTHYMVIDMHHIIADQTSMAVLMREFTMLYEGRILPEKRLRYVDFAAWQNRLIESGQLAKQKEYWKNELSGEIPTLDFPTDFRKTEHESDQGKVCRFTFDPALCEEMNHWLGEKRLTGYALAAAALELLLWKYTEKKDFIFGTAFSGRRSADLNDVIGMFVNTMPIRANIDEKVSAEEFVRNVRGKLLSALEAQDCQFEQLVEELGLNATGSNPLFDFMLNYVSVGTEDFEIDGLKVEPCDPDEILTKYDFTVIMIENHGSYQVNIEYRTDLFRDETAELFGERFMQTIRQLIRDENIQLNDYSLMTAADWAQLDLLNQTETDIPTELSTAEIFAECVRKYGDEPALVWKDTTYTYTELDRMAGYIAGQLQAAGVKVGDRVGLMLKEGFSQIASIFGVLKCGAAYMPIDCAYPEDRIAYMVENSKAVLVITTEAHASHVPEMTQKLVISDDAVREAAKHDSGFVLPDGLNGSLEAYIIYTSGSTGNPKGVVICCHSLTRTILNTNYYHAEHTDRMLQMSNYTFDASVMSIFSALLNGAALVLVPRETVLEVPEFAKLIQEQRITQAVLVTAVFSILVDYDVNCLKGLSRIVIGGEAISYPHVRKALSVLGPGVLVNGYGPTEQTVISTYYEVNALDDDMQIVPIGVPVSNSTVYITDRCGNVLPPHMIGELCVGGIGLAKEYLNNPGVTAEKFIQLKERPDERVYRTGDNAMMLSDGNIIYKGRIDTQIKLRGYRIELGEIERKLMAVTGVLEAAVLCLTDNTGSPYLAAYYTAEEAANMTVNDIRYELRQSLPDYMIPSQLIQLPDMPMTLNNKIDRKKLMTLQNPAQPELKQESQRALSHTTAVILKEMQEVLGRPDLNADDDFLVNGGHSMKAILLVQRLKNAGIEVMVNDVMHHPTAAALSSLCGDSEEFVTEEADTGTAVITDAQKTAFVKRVSHELEWLNEIVTGGELVCEFPMADIQKAHRRSGAVQSGFTVVLQDDRHATHVRKRLAALIVRNQILHCTMKLPDETWLEWDTAEQQAVLEQSIPYVDLSGFEAESRTAMMQQLFTQMMYQPYQPESLPWRAACVQCTASSVQVIWTFHHSAFDGMSAEILKRALQSGAADETAACYSDYVKQIEKGPEGTTPAEFAGALQIPAFAEQNSALLDAMRRGSGDLSELVITVPMQESDADAWDTAYTTTEKILAAYYGLPSVPMVIVHYGRQYQEQSYFDCIGEFLDLVPLTADDKGHDTEQLLESKLQYLRAHNISVSHLLFGKQDTEYAAAAEPLRAFVHENGKFDMMMFNFQGRISEEELQMFASNDEPADAPEQSVFALTATACYHESDLRISLHAVSGFDEEKLQAAVKAVCGEVSCQADGKNLQTV
ncbi:MAG: amino acid adenylation domain-containing protein [Oscillospiraceae bacterium]|nr:amino acid adenylation domain-containing protein [Oscillospiraceae bacterium]